LEALPYAEAVYRFAMRLTGSHERAILSDVEGLGYEEIASLMDVPVGTVKRRLFRGRRRLQESLYEYAVEMGYIRPDPPTEQ